MRMSLISRYPDLKQRFQEACEDDDLDDSLNQPKYEKIYAEALGRWEAEKQAKVKVQKATN